MDVQAILTQNTAGELQDVFKNCAAKALSQAREIRIRQGLPLAVQGLEEEFFIGRKGDKLTTPLQAFRPSADHVAACLERFCSHSLYAFDSEIKNGYITIPGGHRVGLCGRVALEDGRIKTIKHISGLTLRFAREILGGAEKVLPYIFSQNSGAANCVFISPPGCGKTTLLRDVVRRLSWSGHNISVVDERSEIGGCHLGVAQTDLGPRTDVLDAAPKAAGMKLALRALSPQIIAVDEIGGREDAEAIETIARSGVAILCTLHGKTIEDLQHHPNLAPLLQSRIFSRFIFLSDKPKPGTVTGIYDENFTQLEGAKCYPEF